MLNFILNSQLWGYDPKKNLFVPIRGHKFHIIPTSALPFTISIAALILVISIVMNLHLEILSYSFTNKTYNLGFYFSNLIWESWLSKVMYIPGTKSSTISTIRIYSLYDYFSENVNSYFLANTISIVKPYFFNFKVIEGLEIKSLQAFEAFVLNDKISTIEQINQSLKDFSSDFINLYYFTVLYTEILSPSLTNILIYKIYFFWISPFLLLLGIFFIWSSTAVEEGSNYFITNKYVKVKNKIYLSFFSLLSSFHNNLVWKGFKIGFILFIVSEVMFFFGFFFGFFHSALSPVIQIGAVWPPIGVEFITIKGFAIANTVILLTSGLTLTIAHYALELLPQKRNVLYKEGNLVKPVEYLNTSDYLNGIKADVVTTHPGVLPSFNFLFVIDYLHKYNALDLNRFLYLFNPLKLYFLPSSKYFSITPSTFNTEDTIRTYVGFLVNLTVLLAFLFMSFQIVEYFISPVHINSGVYGSTFYMITGLHGIHVFIGTCFLMYCRTAIMNNKSLSIFVTLINLFQTRKTWEAKWLKWDHMGLYNETKTIAPAQIPQWYYGSFGIESFECAAWYWHFVDVVWIFVYAFVYIWSHTSVLKQL